MLSEKADLKRAIYERVVVAGPEIIGVRPTQVAYAHGLALALPRKGCDGAPDRVQARDHAR